jgi:hypothetical protein
MATNHGSPHKGGMSKMARRNEKQVTITFQLDPSNIQTQAAVLELIRMGIPWNRIGVRDIKRQAGVLFTHYGLSADSFSDLNGNDPDDDEQEHINKTLDRIFGWH